MNYLWNSTSNNSGQAPTPPQTANAPANTWTNTITSGIAGIKKVWNRESEEDDADHEDCSHVSHALRAYYVKQNRPFPSWLPPDPKKPAAPPAQHYGQYGNPSGIQAQGRPMQGGQGGLADIWDPTPAQQPQSLRATRPNPMSMRSHDPNPPSSGYQNQGPQQVQATHSARVLPNRRAVAHQTSPAAGTPAAIASRDKLRARLQPGNTGRSSSPATGSGQGASFSSGQGDYNNSYSSQGSGGSPYVGAAEPWSNNSDPYARDSGYSRQPPNQYSNSDHRQRQGSYR